MTHGNYSLLFVQMPIITISICQTGFYTDPWEEQFYTGLTLLLMFLIPLVILIATYLLTFRSISYSEKQFLLEIVIVQNGNQGTIEQVGQMVKASYGNRQKLLQRAKYKSLRMGVLIILAFIICWTPYYIMMIVVVYTDADQEVTIFRQHKMQLFK